MILYSISIFQILLLFILLNDFVVKLILKFIYVANKHKIKVARKTGHDTSTKRCILNNVNYKRNTKSVKCNEKQELLKNC